MESVLMKKCLDKIWKKIIVIINNTMTTPPERIEDISRKFNNKLALQLTPSNDTITAVRTARKLFEEYLITHHQQLQKARETWLREEIVKLKGMKIKELPSSLDDTTGFVMGHSKNITIQTIIDRYQSELDQPNK
jgi:hypothetical protein